MPVRLAVITLTRTLGSTVLFYRDPMVAYSFDVGQGVVTPRIGCHRGYDEEGHRSSLSIDRPVEELPYIDESKPLTREVLFNVF